VATPICGGATAVWIASVNSGIDGPSPTPSTTIFALTLPCVAPGSRVSASIGMALSADGEESAEVILSNYHFGPRDVMIVFSAGGETAVPIEIARGAKARGLRVVAVTSLAQSTTRDPDAVAGDRLADEADLVIDLCTPHADALVAIDGVDTPVGPGTTLAAVAVVNSIKVRTAQLLAERGALPPTITRASVVGAERSRALFDAAYQEHARRIARALAGEG